MRFAGNWRDLDWRSGWGRTLSAAGCLVALVPVGLLVWSFLSSPGSCSGCLIQLYPNPTPTIASPAAVTIPAVGPPVGSQDQGNRFAHWMLSRVRLPAGAEPAASPPVEVQVPPTFAGWQILAGMTSAGGVWRVSLPTGQAIAFFEHNPPGGWRLSRTDDTGKLSGDISGAVNTVLVFTGGPVPKWVGAAQVLVSVHPDGTSASFVRADVQLGWYGARSTAEYIGGFGAMTVSGPRGTRTVTDPAVIATMARLLNALPASPWFGWPIPGSTSVCGGKTYSVAFAAKRDADPWTKVDVECQIVNVSVWVSDRYDYADQPILIDSAGRVSSYIASLLR